MKQNKSFPLCFLLLSISFASLNAQQYFGNSVMLDPTKSVLVSSGKTDKIADSSVIGAALLKEGDKDLEYRSLLQFNLRSLPKRILADPSLIYSAELVLYPVPEDFAETDENKPRKFIVRRVLQPWEDSTTLWNNLPEADLSFQAAKFVKAKNKDYPVTIKVTDLVMEMLKKGDNGFMIFPETSGDGSIATGQLFTSAKYENKEIRPLLIINLLISPMNVPTVNADEYTSRSWRSRPGVQRYNNPGVSPGGSN